MMGKVRPEPGESRKLADLLAATADTVDPNDRKPIPDPWPQRRWVCPACTSTWTLRYGRDHAVCEYCEPIGVPS